MPLTADGVYDRDAPGAQAPTMNPWQSNEERLVDLALWTAFQAPRESLRSGPMIPPRFGYRQHALTIGDVLQNTQRQVFERLDFSGQVGGYAGGTSTPSLGH